MQRILVVGGAGYIGSHMVLALQAAGYHPVVFDNLSKGHRNAIQDAEFIQGDIADAALLHNLFSQYTFSAVMHFASLIEVAESVQFPEKYYQNNVSATLTLLDVMLKNNVRQFIFSSTAAVYGEPNSAFINEQHPRVPINPYGCSKRIIEDVLHELGCDNAIHYAALRYFNAAGADPAGRAGEQHQPESHLIPIVLQVAAGQRDKIIVNGNQYPTPDGTCVRDYVHVADICTAHLAALQLLLQGKKQFICNLGTGRGYSVLEVIHAATRVTECPIPFVIGAARPGDSAVLVADASLAHKELIWQPCYPHIEQIIQHAWEFMRHKVLV